jgi:hypothetical protein
MAETMGQQHARYRRERDEAREQVNRLRDELRQANYRMRQALDERDAVLDSARVGTADTQPERAGVGGAYVPDLSADFAPGGDWHNALPTAGGKVDAAPEVTSWIDRMGDVWTFDEDGIGHSPETAPFSRKYVERKWGPLRPDPSTTPADTAPESGEGR